MDSSQLAVKSARPERKRRLWPLVEKQRIIRARLEPGASVALIARANGINANQVFAWRRQYRRGELRVGSAADMALVPVRLASEPDQEEAPRPGRIQIEAGRVRLEVEPGADARLLRLILETVLR